MNLTMRIFNSNRSLAATGMFVALMHAMFLAAVTGAHGQPLNINTLAGYAGSGGADGVGSAARFTNPWGVAMDSAGNLYVADTDHHTIRKITSGGVVTTLAGKAGISGSADGIGSDARFNLPQGIAVDGATNIYVADTGNFTIRKITPAGVVTTLAGSPGSSGTNNAAGANARFYEPEGIAVNSAGTFIYVADSWNHLIRQITAAGSVTTLAGAAGNPGTNNGTGTSAQFNQPQGIAVDGDGTLYVGDTGNQTIRKITAAGVVSTLAGSPGNSGTNNGTGAVARFWDPQGVALDTATNIYVADSVNNTIRRITPGGSVSTFAGTAGSFGSADGLGGAARFWQPQGVAVDSLGNVYVADGGNGTIRKLTAGAVVSTLAGSASIGSTNGPGIVARFNGATGAAVDGAGNSYVTDTGNSTIRLVTSAGVATNVAGLAGVSGTSDGAGTNARFFGPQGAALNAAGGFLYVADTANHTIRKLTTGGAVTTVAGTGGVNGVADGNGNIARFNFPRAVAVDGAGDAYVADTWNHTIRKVTSGGVVTTFAGAAGSFGSIDDNEAGNGTNRARFYCPSALAVDGAGNVYVADTGNHTIRRVTAAGVVSTLAGMPGVWGSADGSNGSARFFEPTGISLAANGNLLVVDSGNGTIRQLAISGTNCVVTTIAGTPGASGANDGIAAVAQFSYPAGIAIGSAGQIVIADSGNNTLRSAAVITNSAPMIFSQPAGLSVAPGASASFAVSAGALTQVYYQWFFNGVSIPGATAAAYTRTNVQIGDVGPYSVLVSNQVGSVMSANALLTLLGPPVIITQPVDQLVLDGENVTFTVLVTGTQPLQFQWQFNGSQVAGATTSSLDLGPVGDADSGVYAVAVTNAQGVAMSSNAVLAVTTIGLWGDDSLGQLNLPPDATNAIAIAAGAWHNLGLRVNGTVFAWGNNSNGQCDVPETLNDALAVAAGGYHSLALRAGGTVAAWGANDHDQTNVPPAVSNIMAVAAGTWHSLALRRDGIVAAWGDNGWGQSDVPPGLSNVIAIAAGGNHSMALRQDGTVVAWGENTDSEGNYSGQSVVPTGLTNVSAIGAGKYHSLAVRIDGIVVPWGDDSKGQCDVPPGLSNVVAVAGGGGHTLALVSDGTVSAWGANLMGQSNVPAAMTNVIGVSAGENHSVALVSGNLPTPLLLSPAWQNGRFGVLLQTLNRKKYALDFKNTVTNAAWTPVVTNSGNGVLRQLEDPAANGLERFYRMRQW